MKTLNWLLVLFFIVLLVDIGCTIKANYEYEKKIESYWALADKASSIPKKLEGIDKFVIALDNAGMKGEYNALILSTPNNSFDANFDALKSLQTRMHEIEHMDVNSFQYQTALSQITEQEQGQAHAMLSVFKGTYWKAHYILLWDWIGTINWILCIGGIGAIVLFKFVASDL
jgi:hypothetical protein